MSDADLFSIDNFAVSNSTSFINLLARLSRILFGVTFSDNIFVPLYALLITGPDALIPAPPKVP